MHDDCDHYKSIEICNNHFFCPSQEAERAIQCLNGKLALSKKLVVRWAHAQVKVGIAIA